MATHSSAKKRLRQSEKRRVRNASVRTSVKSAIKKVSEAMEAGKADAALESLKKATRMLDSAVTKGVLHRNTASRKVSRLTRAVNSASQK